MVDLEPDERRVSARIFTAQEKLPFAGHPSSARRRCFMSDMAAGPAAAYLAAHGLVANDEAIVVNQGRFLGRPSKLAVTPDGAGELWVGEPVASVARGTVDAWNRR